MNPRAVQPSGGRRVTGNAETGNEETGVLAAIVTLTRIRATLAMLGWMLFATHGTAHDVVIEVAPSGRDQLPASALTSGARLGPVRTIDYAVALARDVRRVRPDARDLAIVLSPGLHRIETPVKLGPGDSGTAGAPLVIRGSTAGDTVIRGSVPILAEAGGAKPGDPRLQRLGAAARSNVRVYRMPERLAAIRQIDTARPQSLSIVLERFTPLKVPSVPFEVFDDAGALVPARWPNTGWGRVEAPAGDGWWTFTTDAPRSADWQGEPDLWTAGYWKFDYAYERHQVRHVEPRTLHLATPFVLGLKPGARFHVYHALAELDAPGEWYRDHASNTLIAWPRARAARRSLLEVSVAASAFQIEGASHIQIKDLTIERFHGDAVRVTGSSHVVVEASTIRWAGLRAAAFVDSRESGIANSDISDTGEGGVLLAAGDRQLLLPAGLFVRNCRIIRFARIGRTFKPAVDMHGVGNVIAENYIADAPSFGIQFQGNDHRIEGNEITGVVDETTDSGAIYTGKDWTARGTVLRHNFLHDLQGRAHQGQTEPFEVKGIYLDDFASGLTVQGNLFLRVEQPVFLGGGRDNLVSGNVFVASQPAVHIDARGLEWAAKYVVDPASDLRTRLSAIPVSASIWRERYPQLPNLLADSPGVAQRNVSRGNVFVAGQAYRLATQAEASKQALGPDFGAGGVSLPIKPALVASVLTAKTATDVGALIGLDLAAAGAAALPYDTMDRASRAGRPSRPSR